MDLDALGRVDGWGGADHDYEIQILSGAVRLRFAGAEPGRLSATLLGRFSRSNTAAHPTDDCVRRTSDEDIGNSA